MSEQNSDPRTQLMRLSRAMVDDILDTPDEVILAEYAEDGGDPAELAIEMRALLDQAIVRTTTSGRVAPAPRSGQTCASEPSGDTRPNATCGGG